MMNRLKNVETIIPSKTAVPSECRAALPAPEASTSGDAAGFPPLVLRP